MSDDTQFELLKISDIEDSTEDKWLVTDLWAACGVGIIGGKPKAGKTWLGLDIALSVASGTPCLDKFDVPEAGPVLLYLAEDSLSSLKARLSTMSQHRGLDLSTLPLYTLTVPRMRIDREDDRKRLTATVGKLKPKLLLLDPLVRISTADENSANEVAEVLGYLRSLQREYETSVILTHHARRAASSTGQPSGVDHLRGSGDLYAWVDSIIFIHKNDAGALCASVEHRGARAPDDFGLALVEDDDGMRLELREVEESTADEGDKRPIRERIMEALQMATSPLNVHDLRARLGGSKDTLQAHLAMLVEEQLVRKEGARYLLN